MSDPKEIEKDLREYLDKEPNLSRQDKLILLQTIFHKHFEVSKLEHLINYKDVFNIFSVARSQYVNRRLPMYISKKLIEPNEAPIIAAMEALIMYLNSKSLLKRLVKFDYKDFKD